MGGLELALILIQLTTADGARVFVNPEGVIKLYPTREAAQAGPNRMVVKGARCVVTFADGKFLAVLEECDYLRSLLEGKRK